MDLQTQKTGNSMTDFRDNAFEYSAEPNTIGTLTLASAKANQGWALEKIERTYQTRVLQWCRAKGLNHADCEDASQTVFLGLLTGIQRFARNEKNQSLGAWLRCVAERKSSDIRRKYARMKTEYWSNLELAPQAHTEDHSLTSLPKASAWSQRVMDAMEIVKNECEPHTWRAFEEVVINGRQAGDVAAQLGVDRNVVYLAKSRLLRRLRELLASD